jgi:alkylated DNA repair dioxygenase AlkB
VTSSLWASRLRTLPPGAEPLPAPDAHLWVIRSFLGPVATAQAFASVHAELPWRQDRVRVFGRAHPIPRMHAWVADAGATYRWSGLHLDPSPWTPGLQELRSAVEEALGLPLRGVLANLYRDGADRMGWHSDDEPELGPEPLVVSLSLGAPRDLRLRPRPGGRGAPFSVRLGDGDLFGMAGPTQAHWQHCIPPRRSAGPRISLTFRPMAPPR